MPGDSSKPYTTYGPEVNTTAGGGGDDDDDIDLFGSDEEEGDLEAVRLQEERLAAYKAKNAAKPKPAAKSIVIMEVKPWGKF